MLGRPNENTGQCNGHDKARAGSKDTTQAKTYLMPLSLFLQSY
jgi:hypothetical protein